MTKMTSVLIYFSLFFAIFHMLVSCTLIWALDPFESVLVIENIFEIVFNLGQIEH